MKCVSCSSKYESFCSASLIGYTVVRVSHQKGLSMEEERTSGLGEVVADIANMMGRKLDEHSIILHQHNLQFDGLRHQLNEQEITLYEHGAILKEHRRDIREIKIQQHSMNEKIDNNGAILKEHSRDIREIKIQQH